MGNNVRHLSEAVQARGHDPTPYQTKKHSELLSHQIVEAIEAEYGRYNDLPEKVALQRNNRGGIFYELHFGKQHNHNVMLVIGNMYKLMSHSNDLFMLLRVPLTSQLAGKQRTLDDRSHLRHFTHVANVARIAIENEFRFNKGIDWLENGFWASHYFGSDYEYYNALKKYRDTADVLVELMINA